MWDAIERGLRSRIRDLRGYALGLLFGDQGDEWKVVRRRLWLVLDCKGCYMLLECAQGQVRRSESRFSH